MSNILIIKHGALGDIAQISGVLRDIRETHKNEKIFRIDWQIHMVCSSRTVATA